MNRINGFRACIRPIVILYCTGILGTLVLLEATGGTAPSSEVSKEIIYAFIGITGLVDVEYFGERAIRHLRADKVRADKTDKARTNKGGKT